MAAFGAYGQNPITIPDQERKEKPGMIVSPLATFAPLR
jgi:hypothetical protein